VKLGEWIEIRGYRKKFIADKLNITTAYLNDIITKRKTPSFWLCKGIEQLTENNVKIHELREDFENGDGQAKQ
jgi:DNA-binding transcriptional regulator YdaS (Cro superfamily)